MRKKWIPLAQCAQQAELERDGIQAERFGQMWVGQRFLFHEGMLRIRYLSLDEIAWAYLRKQELPAAAGCRRCLMPVYYLILVTTGGVTNKLSVDSVDDTKLVLERLVGRNRSIITGYSREHAAKFADRQSPH